MKRGGVTALSSATVGALLVVGCAVRGVQGCYSAVANDGLVDAPLTMSEVSLGDGGEGGIVLPSDAACSGEAGVIPDPRCFGKTLACSVSATGTCSLGDPAQCGETTCLPMTENKDPIYNFRMEQLSVAAPAVLASVLIEGQVVTPAVTLNAPSCGYGPWEAGSATSVTGAFSWLLSIDKSTNTLTTGGGYPVVDPYTSGYCFVDSTFSGNVVAPLPIPITFTGNTFSTTKPSTGVLNVPIFQTDTNLAAPIILPIRGAQLLGVGISEDGNCIGDLNPQWAGSAGSACSQTQSPSCPKWFTNGALGGYMTLEDADKVGVLLTHQSLCVLLLGTSYTARSCTLNGSSEYTCCTPSSDYTKGDYCSTGGTCNDSMWLSATFAANAVKINDASSAACK